MAELLQALWSHAKISENEFYFGEIENDLPQGQGIYYSAGDYLFYGKWERGIMNTIYNSEEYYNT